MWIKLENGSYTRLESASLISIELSGGTYRVIVGSAVVKSNFATQQDAQDALDTLMVSVGYRKIP